MRRGSLPAFSSLVTASSVSISPWRRIAVVSSVASCWLTGSLLRSTASSASLTPPYGTACNASPSIIILM